MDTLSAIMEGKATGILEYMVATQDKVTKEQYRKALETVMTPSKAGYWANLLFGDWENKTM